MPLPISHPLNDTQVDCFSTSIGASPATALVRFPSRGRLTLVGAVAGGAPGQKVSAVQVASAGTIYVTECA